MKVPPDCSVACWSSETMLAPDSARKLLTAATKPGRSVHRSKSRPTSLVVAIPSTLPSRVHLRRNEFRVSFRPSAGGLLRRKKLAGRRHDPSDTLAASIGRQPATDE